MPILIGQDLLEHLDDNKRFHYGICASKTLYNVIKNENRISCELLIDGMLSIVALRPVRSGWAIILDRVGDCVEYRQYD